MYGPRRSIAARCYWMLDEVGVDYTAKTNTTHDVELRAACQALTGVFQVPVLQDEASELVLCESLAINHYLAHQFAPELLGASVHEQSQALQWAFWTSSNLDGPARMLNDLPEGERQSAVEHAHADLSVALGHLGAHLERREFLVGKTFSLADVAVGSAVGSLMVAGLEVSSPPVAAWMATLFARPAAIKLMSQLEPE